MKKQNSTESQAADESTGVGLLLIEAWKALLDMTAISSTYEQIH